MTSQKIRQIFLDFFSSRGHKIVPSSPIVSKDDPTLMFTNAGMNQFKDYFLGNKTPEATRIADTQKCLRVSGKHNDLEEVGRDSYHHTMFEMLGNWSFGDYFKEEAIAWAWELLTQVYGLPADRLYATIFQGDESEALAPDDEAAALWAKWLPADRILSFGKKDNFWEMGETGPCGPCSEIHIDLREEADRARVDGRTLVNMGDPQVVEIWNLVFIQFNRKADGGLEELPAKHVDTGMGFERLTMALQGKLSSYDTDIFTPFIRHIERASGIYYTGRYTADAMSDIAMRVVSDHIRAAAFAIADGQLPSNTGAGYVIRRILRRAVRYYYSFLGIRQPFLHSLIPLLAEYFAEVFPELQAQRQQVAKVIEGEESAFLHTLENGLRRFEALQADRGLIRGEDAFELYDTFGFPIDLTRLLAQEKGWRIDEEGFDKALAAQKARSKADAAKEVGDWTQVRPGETVEFTGYDTLTVEGALALKHRIVKVKKDDQYQVVLNRTPFYAQSGGQVGDQGRLRFGEETVKVLDTVKENELIIHIVERLPGSIHQPVFAEVDAQRRQAISSNHSATHLMHAALHRVLGKHALQKGQDVDPHRLRFDFSHFQKVSEEELRRIEAMVNAKIRDNIPLEEARGIPIEEAKAAGALMLFGEKYGEQVRMITFDPEFSRELCGGTHVPATGHIGLFKIVGESAVAAGIRRIEALSGQGAEDHTQAELRELAAVRQLLKSPHDVARQVVELQEENKRLRKEIEKLLAAQAGALKESLLAAAEKIDGVAFIGAKLSLSDSAAIKNLAYQLEQELRNAVILFGAEINGKPQLMLTISRVVAERKGWHAGNLIRELAKEIKGGGGGQSFFATAGGVDAAGLERAIARVKTLLV
jgi:alanyl-tRNA synthetase